jgi:hypothetical protein
VELSEIINKIYPQLIMLACIYSLVLVVIFLDLWAGIRKAKQRGEYRSSFGLRKTVEKVGKYYNMIFTITVIDAIQMLAISQINAQVSPVTGKAVQIEKAEDKEKAKISEAAKLAWQIMAERSTQEIASKVIDYLKTEKKEGGENG